jgi:hypothetical protein
MKTFAFGFIALFSLISIPANAAEVQDTFFHGDVKVGEADVGYLPQDYVPQQGDRRERLSINDTGETSRTVSFYLCEMRGYGTETCRWRTGPGIGRYATITGWNYTSPSGDASVTVGFISGPSYYGYRPYHYHHSFNLYRRHHH